MQLACEGTNEGHKAGEGPLNKGVGLRGNYNLEVGQYDADLPLNPG